MESPRKLIQWYEKKHRKLPWRVNRTPYRVWISEIMLQQTRVNVVVDYFLDWMQTFPTIESLAKAPFEKVLKKWEGLGYYSRVRNIHKSAKIILEKYVGVFPKNSEEILQLPGIGPYTLGAISSLAFQKKTLALDGNTQRVLIRYYGLFQKEKVREKGEDFLAQTSSWKVTEALIELGALVCQPIPQCTGCPLKNFCKGYQENTLEKLPTKKTKIQYQKIHRAVFVFRYQDELLLHKIGENQIMADLAEFPYVEMKDKVFSIGKILENIFGISNFGSLNEMSPVNQSFTEYRVKLFPYLIHLREKIYIDAHEWISQEALKNLTFSSGHRKILKSLYECFASGSLR